MSSNINNQNDNAEGGINNATPKYTKDMISWRRDIVLQKLSQGWTQQQIARYLKISQPLVSLDTQFLKCQAQDELEHHIQDTIPMHHKMAIQAYMDSIRRVNDIIDNTTDEKTKLNAITTICNIYDRILATDQNGPMVSAAVGRAKAMQSNAFILKEMAENPIPVEEEDVANSAAPDEEEEESDEE